MKFSDDESNSFSGDHNEALVVLGNGDIYCEECKWRGQKLELHSKPVAPNEYRYCPDCGATFMKSEEVNNDNPEHQQQEIEIWKNNKKSVSSENINNLISSYKDKINDDRIFFDADIPDKKIINAINKYAKLQDNEVPSLLVDSSLFGLSAKKGMVITGHSIYACSSVGTHFFILSDINTVSFDKSGDYNFILINDVVFFKSLMKKTIMLIIIRLIQDIIKKHYPEYNESLIEISPEEINLAKNSLTWFEARLLNAFFMAVISLIASFFTEMKIFIYTAVALISTSAIIATLYLSFKLLKNLNISKHKINLEKLIFGSFLIIFSIFEFSTFYLTNNYLAPYLDSNILRNITLSGALPIIAGLRGVQLIYNELSFIFIKTDNNK